MKLIVLLALMLSTAVTMPVFGNDFGSITSAELKAKIDRNEAGLVIVDSRSSSQYQEAHIAGAINIPLAVMEHDPSLPNVPRDATVVFYCSGNT